MMTNKHNILKNRTFYFLHLPFTFQLLHFFKSHVCTHVHTHQLTKQTAVSNIWIHSLERKLTLVQLSLLFCYVWMLSVCFRIKIEISFWYYSDFVILDKFIWISCFQISDLWLKISFWYYSESGFQC